MNYEQLQIKEKCQMKSLFLRTCSDKVHWIETLLDVKNDDAISALDHRVYHHLKFFRLIIKVGCLNYSDTSWWNDLEEIDRETLETGSALELCHLELVRQQKIFHFLSWKSIENPDDRFLTKNHLLCHLLSMQIDITSENFFSIEELLRANQELNEKQLGMFESPLKVKKTEVQLFREYIIVKLYVSVIMCVGQNQEVIDSHLKLTEELLTSMSDADSLHKVLQNILTLIFLRFEHIRRTRRKRKSSEKLSSSVSNQNNSLTTDVSDGTADTLLNGFVCLKSSLLTVLNSLRAFLVKLDRLDVYKSCDDEQKLKFASMIKVIDNTLWRLKIVENEGERRTPSGHSVKEWLCLHGTDSTLLSPHLEITSDEEKKVPKKKISRKKLKRRPKLVMQTDENDEASDEPVDHQLVTETSVTENSENRTQSRSNESHKRVRSVISKILMNPESLVAMCILKNDDDGVAKVIEVKLSIEIAQILREVTKFLPHRSTTLETLTLPTKSASSMDSKKPKLSFCRLSRTSSLSVSAKQRL